MSDSKKGSALAILLGAPKGKGMKDDGDMPEDDSSSDDVGAMHDAAQAMLDAIKADDADALADALHTAHILCYEG